MNLKRQILTVPNREKCRQEDKNGTEDEQHFIFQINIIDCFTFTYIQFSNFEISVRMRMHITSKWDKTIKKKICLKSFFFSLIFFQLALFFSLLSVLFLWIVYAQDIEQMPTNWKLWEQVNELHNVYLSSSLTSFLSSSFTLSYIFLYASNKLWIQYSTKWKKKTVCLPEKNSFLIKSSSSVFFLLFFHFWPMSSISFLFFRDFW